MADEPRRAFKVGSIVWALVLGGAVLFLGASIMMPSTKRARIDFQKLQADHDAAEAQAASRPTTEVSPTANE